MNTLEKEFRKYGSLAEAVENNTGVLSHTEDTHNEKYEDRADADVFGNLAEMLAPDFHSIIETYPERDEPYVDIILSRVNKVPKGRIKLKSMSTYLSASVEARGYFDSRVNPAKTSADVGYGPASSNVGGPTEVYPLTVYNINKFDKDDLIDMTPDVVKWYIEAAKKSIRHKLARYILFGSKWTDLSSKYVGEYDNTFNPHVTNNVESLLSDGKHIIPFMYHTTTQLNDGYEGHVITASEIESLDANIADARNIPHSKRIEYLIEYARTGLARLRMHTISEEGTDDGSDVLGPNTVCFMARSIYDYIKQLKDLNGNYVYASDFKLANVLGVSTIVPLSDLNYPFSYTVSGSSKNWQHMMVFADPTKYYLGVEKENQLDKSYDIDYNQETVQVYGRYSGLPRRDFVCYILSQEVISSSSETSESFTPFAYSYSPLAENTRMDNLIQAVKDNHIEEDDDDTTADA